MVKALLYKDLVNLKKYARTMLLLALVIAVLFRSQGSSLVLVIYSSTLVLTTLSLDERDKFFKRAISDKGRSKAIIGEKFALMGILLAACAILGFIVEVVMAKLFKYDFDMALVACTICSGVAVATLSSCFMLPLTVKFGTEKARLLMIVCYLLPTVIAIWAVPRIGVASLNLRAAVIGIVVALVAMVALSYCISVRMFRKRDY